MENVGKHRSIKVATIERRRNYSVLEPNYHTTNFFCRTSISNRNKKTEILMNRPVYLGLSILELSKILMYEFCYDYIKSKYGKIAKLCYMDTGSVGVFIKTDDFDKDIAEDVETRFET